jgi:hypothetical protein
MEATAPRFLRHGKLMVMKYTVPSRVGESNPEALEPPLNIVPVRAIPRPTPVHLHAKCSSFRAVSFLDIARTGDTRNTYWIPIGNKDSEDGKLYWWVTLRGLRLLDCILSVVPSTSIKGTTFREVGFVTIIRWTGFKGNVKCLYPLPRRYPAHIVLSKFLRRTVTYKHKNIGNVANKGHEMVITLSWKNLCFGSYILSSLPRQHTIHVANIKIIKN